MELEREGGIGEQLYRNVAAGEFRRFLMEGVSCVRVAAMGGEGSAGEFTEICEPTKCNHFEDPVPVDFGTTDWESVEGCGDEPTGEGDPDDSDVGGTSDVGGASDVGGVSDVGGDVGSWDFEEPVEHGLGADFGCGGCSSADGSSQGALVMLLAMLGAAGWGRRRCEV